MLWSRLQSCMFCQWFSYPVVMPQDTTRWSVSNALFPPASLVLSPVKSVPHYTNWRCCHCDISTYIPSHFQMDYLYLMALLAICPIDQILQVMLFLVVHTRGTKDSLLRTLSETLIWRESMEVLHWAPVVVLTASCTISLATSLLSASTFRDPSRYHLQEHISFICISLRDGVGFVHFFGVYDLSSDFMGHQLCRYGANDIASLKSF